VSFQLISQAVPVKKESLNMDVPCQTHLINHELIRCLQLENIFISDTISQNREIEAYDGRLDLFITTLKTQFSFNRFMEKLGNYPEIFLEIDF
jgi:hypothetical protein